MVGEARSRTEGLTWDEGLGFQKYEGLGNDFVVVDVEDERVISRAAAVATCDRRLGVGADGVLLVLPGTSAGSAGRMVVINADGSIPEMCGNGLRCVALHVARKRGIAEGTLTFDTGAGVKTCTIDDRNRRGLVTVDMGIVRWLEDIELTIEHPGSKSPDVWLLSLADAGNPHAITRRVVSRQELERVGHRLATNARFVAGTNVEIVAMRSPVEMDLLVWERGVGITQACGTGACATVAVAVEKGWSPRDTEVAVTLPGGVLHVRIDGRGHAIMRGPARHVFTGKVAGARA